MMRLTNMHAIIAADDAAIAGNAARRAGFKAAATRAFKRDGFVSCPEGGGWTSALTRSAQPGVAFQVTMFGPDGDPRGHGDAATMAEALERLWVNCSAGRRTKRGKPLPDRRPKGERKPAKAVKIRFGRLVSA